MTRLLPNIIAIVAVCIMLGAGEAQAQLVRAYILQDSVTVGDRLTLVVVAEHNSGDVVAFPTFEPAPGQAGGTLGDLIVFGPRSQGRTLLGVGYDYPVADTITYEVATFALDSAFVPQVAVNVTANGQQRRVASDPFFFRVVSIVPPDATSMRDISPIAPFQRSILPFFLVLLGAAIVAAALRWWWRRPAEPVTIEPEPVVVVPSESPIAEAMRRLDELEEIDLASNENLKPFFVELTGCLRTYLERKLSVPALETTTSELYRALRSDEMASRLPDDVVTDVRVILQQSDLVKFAKYKYTEESSRAFVGETRVLLLRIEDQVRAVSPASEGRDQNNGRDTPVDDDAQPPLVVADHGLPNKPGDDAVLQ
jgi:hypothetical protein